MEIEKIKATKKAKDLIETGKITKFDLALKIDIARNTLDTRLSKMNWRKGEILIIKSL